MLLSIIASIYLFFGQLNCEVMAIIRIGLTEATLTIALS